MKKIVFILILISILLSGCNLFDPHNKDYQEAVSLFNIGEYEEAAEIFAKLAGYEYKDSAELAEQSRNIHQEIVKEQAYVHAVDCFKIREYEISKAIFEDIIDYKDSRDYIVTIIYMQAIEIIQNDPDTAVEILIDIKDYNEEIAELVNEALYNIALNYMSDELYEKAFPVLETIIYHKDSDELFELCNKHIKYNNAITEFNHVGHSAYEAFFELGGFLDSVNYVLYIDAARYAETHKYYDAIEKYLYLSAIDFLDSADLYKKYAYMYHVEVLNLGLYIDKSFDKYGSDKLIDYIYSDFPEYYFTDSPEEARYIMSFTGRSRYFGTYNDGTDGYETTVTVMITDTTENQILFSERFTAYPPSDGYLPQGDVFGSFDFFETDENGLSVYDKDIQPVLTKMFKYDIITE